MLNQYKELEEQIDSLTGMIDLELQRKPRDALGLNWGLGGRQWKLWARTRIVLLGTTK